MNQLQQMLVDQLKDAHSAERQAIQAMKRIAKKATEPQLRAGLEAHVAQSEEQRTRVEEALAKLGAKPGRKVCEAMRGLVEEAQHELEDQEEKGPVMDLVIVAAQQRMEHYEIAAYGTMAELARALGEQEVAELLGQTLAEEKAQDERLTEVTRSAILPAALEGGEDEEDEAPARTAANRTRK